MKFANHYAIINLKLMVILNIKNIKAIYNLFNRNLYMHWFTYFQYLVDLIYNTWIRLFFIVNKWFNVKLVLNLLLNILFFFLYVICKLVKPRYINSNIILIILEKLKYGPYLLCHLINPLMSNYKNYSMHYILFQCC